jgi:MFS family permease
MDKNNFDPVGTLSIGNVITTSTILYKSNFKRYFQVSLRATGWLLVILLSMVVAGIVGGFLYFSTQSWLITMAVGLGWIGVFLYLAAKYATDRAVICRLAYQELIEVPETVAVATQQLVPRTWSFLRLSWLVSFYMFIIAAIGYLSLALLVIAITAISIYGLKLPAENPLLIISVALLVIGAFLLWLVILFRFYAYWLVAELPLAVEQTKSARSSIKRSQQLVKTSTQRVLLIITIAFLLTIPINTIGNGSSFIGQIMSSVSTDASTQAMGYLLTFVGFLINLVSELFLMPFWQVIKAIIYYDLRNRREGGDLVI